MGGKAYALGAFFLVNAFDKEKVAGSLKLIPLLPPFPPQKKTCEMNM